MSRAKILILFFAGGTLLSLWFLLQTPGSLGEALVHPFQMLLGTQAHLNATLLEVSESSDPLLAAGRRLLQPLGVVRLVRTYDAPDPAPAKKR